MLLGQVSGAHRTGSRTGGSPHRHRELRLPRASQGAPPLLPKALRNSSSHFPSSAQTADACTDRSRLSRAPVGAGMFSEVVTERVPSAVAAAHCT